MSEIAERIEEAARLARRYHGTPLEIPALAYLRAQVEQARKHQHRTETT